MKLDFIGIDDTVMLTDIQPGTLFFIQNGDYANQLCLMFKGKNGRCVLLLVPAPGEPPQQIFPVFNATKGKPLSKDYKITLEQE